MLFSGTPLSATLKRTVSEIDAVLALMLCACAEYPAFTATRQRFVGGVTDANGAASRLRPARCR